uniref:Uncharacterized protein n=1 Tax=Medicago truncatula TaxID=3880 RepID=A4PU49_MEDTR|nr:hypothetical protein MtrDRAFT_AC144563g15v2 [Medicago truncatula]
MPFSTAILLSSSTNEDDEYGYQDYDNLTPSEYTIVQCMR